MFGDCQELKASKLKIFKKESPMTMEENTLSVLINMGLGMAKSQISQALQIPEMGYPNLKECLGLKLARPQLSIHEGVLRLVTDFDVSPGSLDCD